MLLQQIFFHSVIVVIASNKYKFNALCPSDNKIVDTLSLLIILTTIANILTIMLTYERTLAGVIFINISKTENLPFNVHLKSLLPYLARTCKYPLDHLNLCVTDCLKLERNRNIQIDKHNKQRIKALWNS